MVKILFISPKLYSASPSGIIGSRKKRKIWQKSIIRCCPATIYQLKINKKTPLKLDVKHIQNTFTRMTSLTKNQNLTLVWSHCMNDIFLMSLLSISNIFLSFSKCFYCWLWKSRSWASWVWPIWIESLSQRDIIKYHVRLVM